MANAFYCDEDHEVARSRHPLREPSTAMRKDVGVAIDAEELATVLELLEGIDFSYFQLEQGDVRIILTRGDARPPDPVHDVDGSTPPRVAAAATLTPQPATAAGAANPAPVDDGPAILAPMMGTFYAAPRPGEPNFVMPGDAVEPDTVVGIIEVMKLMTPVVAGTAGVITARCVEDGQLVEFEQPLFRVKTDA